MAFVLAQNGFRVCGDMMHLFAVIIVLFRLTTKKNAQGLSRRTQELLLVVWCARYLDLFTTFYTIYNSFFKIFYILSNVIILVIVSFDPVRSTVREDHDISRKAMLLYILLPSSLCAIVYDFVTVSYYSNHPLNILWNLSIILEPVGLVPQMMLFRKHRQVEHITGAAYLVLMGSYRGLYVLNWIYSAHTIPRYRHNRLVYFCGVIQFAIGVGGAMCCVTSSGSGSVPICLQLRQMYREIKMGWFIGFLVLLAISFHSDMIGNTAHSGESHNVITALFIMSAVGALCIVVYCGFRTEKEIEIDHGSLLETTDEEACENGARNKNYVPAQKMIKKGIFVHGLQVV